MGRWKMMSSCFAASLAISLLGAVDVEAKALGATSGQAAFTAEEKDAINAAVMIAHPSVVVLADPTPSYECHGFTFAAGRLRIYGDQVEKILADQGWILRTAGAHQVGDIAIYRKEGVIRHSGVVSAVQDGTVTRIQSKWGTAGLYEHDPDDVPEDYGRFEIRYREIALAAVHQGPWTRSSAIGSMRMTTAAGPE